MPGRGNPLENFFRDILQQSQGGGAGMSPTIFTTGGDGGQNPFFQFVSDAANPGLSVTVNAPQAQNAQGSSNVPAGNIYSGGVPPMVWIQQEQHRTPLRFNSVTEPSGFDGLALRTAGNNAFQRGEYRRAIDLYTRAIQADPTGVPTYTNRSLAYFKLNEFQKSADDASKAIELKPDFYKGYYRLALAQQALGEYRLALENLRKALTHVPADNRDEVVKAIAKCESKLTRSGGTPLITDAASSSNGFGSAAPSSPRSSPARALCSPLNADDYTNLEQLAASLRTQRQRMDAFETAYESQTDIVECKERCHKVKELLASATSNELSYAAKDAREKQEALRRSLKDPDRSTYLTAKKERDEAYQHVWKVAHEVDGAITQLRQLGSADERFHARFGTQTDGASPTVESSAELPPTQAAPLTGLTSAEDVQESPQTPPPAISPVMTPNTPDESADLPTLLEQRERLHGAIKKVKAYRSATDAAAYAFREAIERERTAEPELDALLAQSDALNQKLTEAARRVAASMNRPLSSNQLEALDQSHSLVQRTKADQESFLKTQTEGDELLRSEAQLEQRRLLAERHRIQIQAEIEWDKVRDEPEARIRALQNRVKAVQDQIAEINASQKKIQQRILELIDQEHPELAWKSMTSGSRILRLVKGSGMWVNYAFSDFQIVSTLSSTANSKVYHAVRRGEHVALKEVAVNDEAAKRRFQREVGIVASCNHPNVIRLRGVFFDGPFAYLLLPYYQRGSVRSLMQTKDSSSWVQVQNFFRQLISALAYLHEHGVVHADIKPSNILVSDDGRPIITDFGIAKDRGALGDAVDVTTTQTGVVGTAIYMAPEQLSPSPGEGQSSSGRSAKSDIWSLGITMFEIAANNAYFLDTALGSPVMPVPMPGRPCIEVPAKRVGGDEKLADMISAALMVDPTRRATAYELLSHPYFSSSLSTSGSRSEPDSLLQSDARLEAVHAYLHAVRADAPKLLVSVSRNHMVESVNQILERVSEKELIEPIMVVFQGEMGIDEGALTSEMLNLYYEQLAKTQVLVCANASDGPTATATPTGSPVGESAGGGAAVVFGDSTYLPAEDGKGIDSKMFTMLGKALLKSIIEVRPLPFRLNMAVLKYFCGASVNMLDLEEYDPELTNSLKHLRLLSADDLAASALDFSVFSESFLESNGRGYTMSTEVTTDNVRDYVDLYVQYELVGKRSAALSAMMKGFFSVDTLSNHLKLLTPVDLSLLLCGVQHVSSQIIVDALEFQGFPSASKTPQYLKEVIADLSQNNLRRFLQLCTSHAALPAQGLTKKIKVLCTGDTRRLPVGHGCVSQLDLPDYNDKAALLQKLEIALAHVNDGFQIV